MGYISLSLNRYFPFLKIGIDLYDDTFVLIKMYVSYPNPKFLFSLRLTDFSLI